MNPKDKDKTRQDKTRQGKARQDSILSLGGLELCNRIAAEVGTQLLQGNRKICKPTKTHAVTGARACMLLLG